jgi:hypothetical protein
MTNIKQTTHRATRDATCDTTYKATNTAIYKLIIRDATDSATDYVALDSLNNIVGDL